jgi:hypothetical protein
MKNIFVQSPWPSLFGLIFAKVKWVAPRDKKKRKALIESKAGPDKGNERGRGRALI